MNVFIPVCRYVVRAVQVSLRTSKGLGFSLYQGGGSFEHMGHLNKGAQYQLHCTLSGVNKEASQNGCEGCVCDPGQIISELVLPGKPIMCQQEIIQEYFY